MNKSKLIKNLTYLPIFLILLACSTAPIRPSTIFELEALKLEKYFKIDNSLEEILGHINREGEVIIEAVSKRRRGVKAKLYYIKIMATPEGLETRFFPIESSE